MIRKTLRSRALCAASVAAVAALLSAGAASAQATNATVRGTLYDGSAVETGGTVVATEVSSGFTYRGRVNTDGGFVIAGLRPGTYRIVATSADGQAAEDTVTLTTGQVGTLNLDVAAVETAGAVDADATDVGDIVVTGRRLQEVRTSEVSTSVSQQQINNLPQINRNFLNFAALALLNTQEPKPRFEDEIRAFEAADQTNPPAPRSILFVGSSSIRLWQTLKEDVPGYKVLNRGYGGSRIDDSVRLYDRVVRPYRPSAIVFYAGTNDLADGHSVETVVADYKTFVGKVRADFRAIPIAFIAIAPAPSRAALRPKMDAVNAEIRAYSKTNRRLYYIDVVPLMLDATGGYRPELFVGDQLHMNADGYKIWTKAVNASLAEMMRKRR